MMTCSHRTRGRYTESGDRTPGSIGERDTSLTTRGNMGGKAVAPSLETKPRRVITGGMTLVTIRRREVIDMETGGAGTSGMFITTGMTGMIDSAGGRGTTGMTEVGETIGVREGLAGAGSRGEITIGRGMVARTGLRGSKQTAGEGREALLMIGGSSEIVKGGNSAIMTEGNSAITTEDNSAIMTEDNSEIMTEDNSAIVTEDNFAIVIGGSFVTMREDHFARMIGTGDNSVIMTEVINMGKNLQAKGDKDLNLVPPNLITFLMRVLFPTREKMMMKTGQLIKMERR